MDDEVLTGSSGSRRLHPKEFIESLKEADAISASICGVFVSETSEHRDKAADCTARPRLDRRSSSRCSRTSSRKGGREEGST